MVSHRLTAFISFGSNTVTRSWVKAVRNIIFKYYNITPDEYMDDPVLGGSVTEQLKRRIEAAQILIFLVDRAFVDRRMPQIEWSAGLERLCRGAPGDARSGIIRNDRLPLVYLFAIDSEGMKWLESQAVLKDVAYIDFSRFEFINDPENGTTPRFSRNFDNWIDDINSNIKAIEARKRGTKVILGAATGSGGESSGETPASPAVVIMGGPFTPIADLAGTDALLSQLGGAGEGLVNIGEEWAARRRRESKTSLEHLVGRDALYLQLCDSQLIKDNFGNDPASFFSELREQLSGLLRTPTKPAPAEEIPLILWLPETVTDAPAEFKKIARGLPDNTLSGTLCTRAGVEQLSKWLSGYLGHQSREIAFCFENTYPDEQDELKAAFKRQLFGSVLALDGATLILLAGIASATLSALAILYRPLVMETVDAGFLASVSKSGGVVQIVFLALVVLNLVGAFHALGTLLAVGMMMLPALSARLMTQDMTAMILLAAAQGILAGYAGLILSFHAGLPSGPLITLLAGFLYLLALVFGPAGGLLRRFYPGRHLEG